MKIKSIISELINYIAALGLSLVFALFLSGRVGWFVLMALIAAPFLSLIFTLPFIKLLKLEGIAEEKKVSKGDLWQLNIKGKNGFILPSPLVIVSLEYDGRLEYYGNELAFNAMPREEINLSAAFTARFCGKGEIRVTDVKIKDYLGIFTIRLKNTGITNLRASVGIIPDIYEISRDSKVFEDIHNACVLADEGEDTEQSISAGFGGFPGYENRLYAPGDPIKRINWKLSARRGGLYIRMDDEVPVSKICVVPDKRMNIDALPKELKKAYHLKTQEQSEDILRLGDEAVSHMLGIVRALFKNGNEAVCLIRRDKEWEKYSVACESDLEELRFALADYTFDLKPCERLPFAEIEEGKESTYLVCTPIIDEELKALAAGGAGKGEKRFVLYEPADREVTGDE